MELPTIGPDGKLLDDDGKCFYCHDTGTLHTLGATDFQKMRDALARGERPKMGDYGRIEECFQCMNATGPGTPP